MDGFWGQINGNEVFAVVLITGQRIEVDRIRMCGNDNDILINEVHDEGSCYEMGDESCQVRRYNGKSFRTHRGKSYVLCERGIEIQPKGEDDNTVFVVPLSSILYFDCTV